MHLISSTADLAAACEALAAHDYVAVDTEFLRETTFWPKLCVVQLAGPDTAVVVDALAEGLDMTPFLELMRDEKVMKVFHSGRQDIEIVFNLGGFVPHPIFDTQVAAMVCGFGDSISYDQLVQKITGAHIDKSSRFTDWTRRPLTQKQFDYALSDVTHLRDVYHHLKKRLADLGRADWVADEMEVLTSHETYDLDPENAWTRLKLRVKKPIELAILKEIAAWREREARSRDVPRSRILKDDAIDELAAQAPTDAAAMDRLRGVPKGFSGSKFGPDLLEAIREALKDPDAYAPKIDRERAPQNAAAGAVVELLKVLLKARAEDAGVASKLLATVSDLEKIANDDNADVGALQGWRLDAFGADALKLKRGELALVLDGTRVRVGEVRRAPKAASA